MKKHPRLYGILSLLSIAFLVFIGKIAYDVHAYHERLLSDGIRVQAQVINMETVQTLKKKKTIHAYLYLAVFEEMTGIPEPKEKVDLASLNTIDEKIDAMFENLDPIKPIGNYKEVRKDVDLSRYGATQIGDWVTFVYLENELEKGKVLFDLK